MAPLKAPAGESTLRVLVSGAGSGPGLACAEAFAARGAELILCDHDGIELTRAAERLGAFSRFCDAVSETSVDVFATEVSENFPAIDVIVNAAGETYVRALAVVRISRALMPLLRRGQGRRLIVNLAPASDCAEHDRMFPYAGSQGAFERLSEALAEQTRGSSIEVVAIRPTLVPPRDSGEGPIRPLDEPGGVDQRSTAEQVVELVAAARPGWRWSPPPRLDRRA